MQSVSSVHSTATASPARTQTANRATTRPIPDVTSIDPADLRSRLEGGEALQARAESAGVESEEQTTTDATLGAPTATGVAPRLGVVSTPNAGRAAMTGGGESAPAASVSGRDAGRAIEDLATTMAVDTATVRQSIDDGSLSQLLAQNGVQSSIGMLFNTRL